MLRKISWLPLAAFAIIAVLLLFGSARTEAQVNTSNLLINPGAETGDLTGWTDSATPNTPPVDDGSFDPGINPHTGSYDFYGGSATASDTLTQTVNIIGVQGVTQAEVNSGSLLANVSFWEQGLNQGTPSDDAEISLTFYNAANAQISSWTSPEVDSHLGSWENYVSNVPIPANTVSISYSMDFIRHAGSDLDGFVDDNSLTIYSQSPTTIAVSPSTPSVVDGATQSFSAQELDQNGVALTTQPTFTWSTQAGSGTITSAGLFTAIAVGGPYNVTAQSGGVSGSAQVTVTPNTGSTGPQVSAVSISSSPIPVTGGATAISATVTPGAASISSVKASIYQNGAYYTQISLAQQGSTTSWSGSISFPGNASQNAAQWYAVVTAADASSNSATAASPMDSQSADTPANFGAVTIPSTVGISGGAISVSTTLTPSASGVQGVSVYLYKGGSNGAGGTYYTDNSMTSGTPVNGVVPYTSSFSIPANQTTNSINWYVTVIETDKVGVQVTSASSNNCTQAANTAASIGPVTVPATIGISGGAFAVSTTLTPSAAGTQGVTANLYKGGTNGVGGAFYTDGTMTAGTAVNGVVPYTSSFSLPANQTTSTVNWYVVVVETDTTGVQITSTASNNCTQADNTAASIGPVTVPTTIGVSGGAFAVSTTLTPSAAGTQGVTANLYKGGTNGAGGTFVTDGTMTAGTADNGVVPYTSSFTIPANQTTSTVNWYVVVVETDTTGVQVTSGASNNCTQADNTAASIGPVTVPATIGISGGAFAVSTTLTPSAAGTQGVTANLYKGGTNGVGGTFVTDGTMTAGTAVNGVVPYTSSFSIPANQTTSTVNWYVAVVETDTTGVQVTSSASNNCTQTANSSALIGPVTVPNTIGVSGGAFAVSTTLAPSAAGTQSITADLYKGGTNGAGGAYYTGGNMTAGTAVNGVVPYTSNFSIPTNQTNNPVQWYVVVTSVDNTGVTTTSSSSNVCTQAAAVIPTITAFSPQTGPVGTPVTLTGTNFGGATNVSFNGVTATDVTINSNTSITATVPPTATTGLISVATTEGTGTTSGLSPSDFTVTVAQNFSVQSTESTLSIGQGLSGGSSISLTNVGGFSNNVALTATGLPNGVTAAFNPTPIFGTGTSALTLTASPTTPVGTTTVTITGTSGALVNSTTISLTITSNPIVTAINLSPLNPSVQNGSQLQFTAVAVDQFGNPISPQPTITWSTTGGGTIDANGNFTATTVGGPFIVSAADGTVANSTKVTDTAVPAFTLSTSLTSLPVDQGSSATDTISFTPLNGYNGNISLSISGAPSGVTAQFVPPLISGTQTSVLTLTAAPLAKVGSATIVVTGTDGVLTATSNIQLNVIQTAVVTTINVSPSSATVISGTSQQFAATALDQNTNPITPAPTFVWAASGGGTIDNTGNFTATTVGGPFNITATVGTVVGTATATVTVPSNFTVNSTSSTVTVNQGAAGSSTISLNNLGGFTGTVALSNSTLPAGVTAAFNPSSISGSTTSSLTFTVSPTATPGAYSIIVSGTSGTLVNTTTINLVVKAATVLTTITVTPSTASVFNGGTQTFTAAAYDQNSNAITPLPAITWSISGGGTIIGNVFTSTTVGGPYTVTATIGPVSGTAQVFVNAGPLITNATIGPATISSSGGNITISAVVTDLSSSITSVNAELLLNGAGYEPIALTSTGGSTPFAATVAVPANTGTTADIYTATITAIDSAYNTNTVNAGGQVSQASPPTTSIIGGPANNSTICTNTAVFTVTGTDAVTPTGALYYQYSLDNGPYSAATQSTTITLTNLSDGTHTLTVAAVDAAGSVDPVGATVTFTVSVNPPVISAISATPVDISSVITWTTDKPTTSQVLFGTTSKYGSSSLLFSSQTTSHSVTISGLTPNTMYHYQVVSGNSCNQSTSPDNTFTTLTTQLSNLEVTQLSATSQVIQGQSVQVSWTVSNVGLGSASGTWNDQLYLSTTPNFTSGAVLVGTYVNPITLLEGQSYSETQQVTLPSADYGSYYLILYSNQAQTQTESNFTDNANATSVNISKQQQLLVTPSTISTSLNIGVAQIGYLTIQSNSNSPISGLAATVTGLPSNITANINIPSTSLTNGQTETVAVTVTANNPSVLAANAVIHFTDAQGDAVPANLNLNVINPAPLLTVQPGSINTGMVDGTQTIYALTVTNTGASTAKGLMVDLPSSASAWLSLASSGTLGDLAPGASATVNLDFSPAANLALGQYTGNLAINGTNTGVSVNYSIENTTTATGTVTVTSADEYTYLEDTHPPLTGADVTITNAQTGAVILSGVTDDTGTFTSTITAGYYDILVTSPDHANYSGPLQIQPGSNTDVQAFLSKNLVTYTWNVIPVQTTDTYDITVDAVFQTHVPAPEVTVSPALLNLSTLTFDSTGKAVVNYTLTNAGLIAANDTKFTFPNQATYDMVPAITNIGTLAAESSIVIPVTIYAVNPNGNTPSAAPADAKSGIAHANGVTATPNDDGGCPLGGTVTYDFTCGADNDNQSSAADVSGGGGCGIEGIPAGGGGGGGGGDGGGAGINSGDFSGLAVSGSGSLPTAQLPQFCNPCLAAVLVATAECLGNFLPTGCPISIGITAGECGLSVSGSSTQATIGIAAGSCALGIGGSLVTCVGDAFPALNLISCAYGLGTACVDTPGSPFGGASLPAIAKANAAKQQGIDKSFGAQPADNSTGNPFLDGLITDTVNEANRASVMVQPYIDFFGSNKWLECANGDIPTQLALVTAFLADCSPNPNSPQPITPTENTALDGMPLPGQLKSSDVDLLVKRWNNSMAYYALGEVTAAQLPAGDDPNFIDYGQLSTDSTASQAAQQQDEALGYNTLYAGMQTSLQNVQAYIQNPNQDSAGVCATVTIQLNQTVELTRTTFQGTLNLTNSAQNVPLTGISVNLHITDANGVDQTSLFVISTPDLTVFNGALDGTGSLQTGSTGTAQWSILPTRAAAANGSTQYYVGGTISYYQNGTLIQVPLFPTGITVLPDPYLQFHYFWNQQVYSQDPLDLPTIDPVEPFYLGVLVQNNGGGVAQNLSITSSQPSIIDNQKGLAINFDIIGTEVNLNAFSPSLSVDLGNIAANGGTAAATFEMTSSLSGTFTGFTASFKNTNPLGNAQTSLIDSVDTHFLNHIVQITPTILTPTEPDFLTEESNTAVINDVPDTVWQGQTGSETGVTSVLGDEASEPISNSVSSVTLNTPDAPTTGYVFIRINDPGVGQYALESVTRSDGKVIPIGTDAWLTKRMVHPAGAAAYLQTYFYIFDSNTTGSYTLNYYPAAPVVSTISPTTVAAGSPSFTLFVNGSGFVNGANIVVNGAEQTTQFVSSSQLTATIPASIVLNPTSLNISVSNPGGVGAATGAVILPVTSSAGIPVVSISTPATGTTATVPASIALTASATEQNGTITEVDFYANNVWIGKSTTAPYTVNFTTTAAGNYQIIALATDANNVTVTSSAITISVGASTSGVAAPITITSLSPQAASAGSPTFTLTVNGSGYTNNSTVQWNGQALPTSYISSTQLTATVAASFVAQAGTASISVANPSLGSGISTPLSFTITSSTPVISGLVPSTVLSGSSAFTLIVNGSLFAQTDTINWNGSPLATTYISATQLSAAVPASLVASVGTPPVTVVNPALGSLTSSPSTFTITMPVAVPPTITLTSPTASSVFTAPASITTTATATAYQAATVTKVVFNLVPTSGPTLTETVTTSPYTYAFTSVPQGTYSVTAKVTDSNGNTAVSTPVSVVVSAPVSSAPTNETSNVTVTKGVLSRVGRTTSYSQTVTVTNKTNAVISQPISLVLDGITAGDTLVNPTGTTTSNSGGTVGSPYVSVSTNLAANGSVVFTLTFTDPSLGSVAYTTRVFAGPGNL